VSIFIRKLSLGNGTKVAIKDNFDIKGQVTTAGSPALKKQGLVATNDADCVKILVKNGAKIIGTTNMNELALGVTGINPYYGTPENPINPKIIPGGSSSGCAVGVALNLFDFALGTDTGGSIRIPATCCAVAGLKTTFGRLSTKGLYPLSASLDTVGPIAKDVKKLIIAMKFLEPNFKVKTEIPKQIALFSGNALPQIKNTIIEIFNKCEIDLKELEIPLWSEANQACLAIMHHEAFNVNKDLVKNYSEYLSDGVIHRLKKGESIDKDELKRAFLIQKKWKNYLTELFDKYNHLVTPTLSIYPPEIKEADLISSPASRLTLVANLAGVPAISLPIMTKHGPIGLQLISPENGEEALLGLSQEVEAIINHKRN
jgi:amidase